MAERRPRPTPRQNVEKLKPEHSDTEVIDVTHNDNTARIKADTLAQLAAAIDLAPPASSAVPDTLKITPIAGSNPEQVPKTSEVVVVDGTSVDAEVVSSTVPPALSNTSNQQVPEATGFVNAEVPVPTASSSHNKTLINVPPASTPKNHEKSFFSKRVIGALAALGTAAALTVGVGIKLNNRPAQETTQLSPQEKLKKSIEQKTEANKPFPAIEAAFEQFGGPVPELKSETGNQEYDKKVNERLGQIRNVVAKQMERGTVFSKFILPILLDGARQELQKEINTRTSSVTGLERYTKEQLASIQIKQKELLKLLPFFDKKIVLNPGTIGIADEDVENSVPYYAYALDAVDHVNLPIVAALFGGEHSTDKFEKIKKEVQEDKKYINLKEVIKNLEKAERVEKNGHKKAGTIAQKIQKQTELNKKVHLEAVKKYGEWLVETFGQKSSGNSEKRILNAGTLILLSILKEDGLLEFLNKGDGTEWIIFVGPNGGNVLLEKILSEQEIGGQFNRGPIAQQIFQSYAALMGTSKAVLFGYERVKSIREGWRTNGERYTRSVAELPQASSSLKGLILLDEQSSDAAVPDVAVSISNHDAGAGAVPDDVTVPASSHDAGPTTDVGGGDSGVRSERSATVAAGAGEVKLVDEGDGESFILNVGGVQFRIRNGGGRQIFTQMISSTQGLGANQILDLNKKVNEMVEGQTYEEFKQSVKNNKDK